MYALKPRPFSHTLQHTATHCNTLQHRTLHSSDVCSQAETWFWGIFPDSLSRLEFEWVSCLGDTQLEQWNVCVCVCVNNGMHVGGLRECSQVFHIPKWYSKMIFLQRVTHYNKIKQDMHTFTIHEGVDGFRAKIERKKRVGVQWLAQSVTKNTRM